MRSTDLISREYVHPLYVGDKRETGEMWECPSFFALDDTYVLAYSNFVFNPVEYFTGTYQNLKFEPVYHGLVDHSGLFYAPQSFADETGRRLIFGWIREARSDALTETAGWAGLQSIPRVLVPLPGGRLGIKPAPELQVLRNQHIRRNNLSVSSDNPDLLNEVQGNSLEIVVTVELGAAHRFGLSLLRSPGGEEETTLVYDRLNQTLTLDRTRSCARPEGIDMTPQSAPLRLADGSTLNLHIFLDRSVIEIFANGHTALTSRVYPTRADSLGLGVSSGDNPLTISQIDIWKLASIW